jgi:hypothetical protein
MFPDLHYSMALSAEGWLFSSAIEFFTFVRLPERELHPFSIGLFLSRSNVRSAYGLISTPAEHGGTFPRTNTALQLQLTVESSGVPIRTETSDICEMGCYVHMNITLELGTRVSIILWLDDRKVCGTGSVVTRHPQFGNGI